MIILGLDPGIARTGFGVINSTNTNTFITCGCLTTSNIHSLAERLLILGDDLNSLVERHRPELCVIESVFFGANTKTAMLTAQARGVLLYILRKHHIEVQELTPLQIKSRLTGYGSADKHQIQTLVTQQLNLHTVPDPDDAADALAAALCAIK